MRSSADFQALLSALVQAEVEFVVVGGVGAVLRGAPVTTFDLDIVQNRTAENVSRLLDVLGHLKSKFRTHPHVEVSADVLLGPGHVRLMTELGPLDVLGEVGDELSYSDLLKDSSKLDVGGFSVPVLSLRGLIRIKESVGREKDKAILPVLRRTLEQSEDAG